MSGGGGTRWCAPNPAAIRIAAIERNQAREHANETDAECETILNEMDTMTDAITAVRDWIVVNYPVDPSGFLLTYTITGGRFADTGLSAALAAPLLPFLDTLIASID